MARIRSLRPEFFTDSKIAKLSAFARLLYQGLWVMADDSGRGLYLPKKIEGDVFPYDDIDIHVLLTELIDLSFIIVYGAGGDLYFHIPTFNKYQKPEKAIPSKLPPPPGRIAEDSPNPPRILPESSPNPPPLEIGDGDRKLEIGDGDRSVPGAHAPDARSDNPSEDIPPPKPAETWGEFFDAEVWPNRPRRSGSDSHRQALTAFVAVLKANCFRGITPEHLRDKHQEYRRWCEATGKIGTERVMQVASFFGPQKEGWRNDWEIPESRAPDNGAGQVVPLAYSSAREARIRIEERLMAQEGGAS